MISQCFFIAISSVDTDKNIQLYSRIFMYVCVKLVKISIFCRYRQALPAHRLLHMEKSHLTHHIQFINYVLFIITILFVYVEERYFYRNSLKFLVFKGITHDFYACFLVYLYRLSILSKKTNLLDFNCKMIYTRK